MFWVKSIIFVDNEINFHIFSFSLTFNILRRVCVLLLVFFVLFILSLTLNINVNKYMTQNVSEMIFLWWNFFSSLIDIVKVDKSC